MTDALQPIVDLLRPGTVTLLVGGTNAGKTTVALHVSLLVSQATPVRFMEYDPTERTDAVFQHLKGIEWIKAGDPRPGAGVAFRMPDPSGLSGGLLVVGEVGALAILMGREPGRWVGAHEAVAVLADMVEAHPDVAVLAWANVVGGMLDAVARDFPDWARPYPVCDFAAHAHATLLYWLPMPAWRPGVPAARWQEWRRNPEARRVGATIYPFVRTGARGQLEGEYREPFPMPPLPGFW